SPQNRTFVCQSECPLWVKSGHKRLQLECPLRAKSGHRSRYTIIHSVTLSARGLSQFEVLSFARLVPCERHRPHIAGVDGARKAKSDGYFGGAVRMLPQGSTFCCLASGILLSVDL